MSVPRQMLDYLFKVESTKCPSEKIVSDQLNDSERNKTVKDIGKQYLQDKYKGAKSITNSYNAMTSFLSSLGS